MTEKDYNPKQREMKSMKKMEASSKPKKQEKVEVPKKEKSMKKLEDGLKKATVDSGLKKDNEKGLSKEEVETKKTTEEKKPSETQEKETVKPEKKETPKVKKTEAMVNVSNFPISTKASSAVCKFIKKKKIEIAIKELEEVFLKKRAIPAKGEMGHKKGKRMSTGIFATKTVSHFIRLLKSLLANANTNGLETPVISEAIANIGSRPYGRFGRTRKKRTHIKVVAKELKPKNKKQSKEKK